MDVGLMPSPYNYGKPAKSVTPQFQGQGEKTRELVTGDSDPYK